MPAPASPEPFRIGAMDALTGVSESLGAAPLAEREGVIMLSASATSLDIATAGDYYYRRLEGVKRTWFAFIVDPNGEVVLSRDRSAVGRQFKDLLGIDDFEASSDGNWVATESLQFWAMERDNWLFASGWYQR